MGGVECDTLTANSEVLSFWSDFRFLIRERIESKSKVLTFRRIDSLRNSPGHRPRACQSPGTSSQSLFTVPFGYWTPVLESRGHHLWCPRRGAWAEEPARPDEDQTFYYYPWNVQKFIKKLINFLADFRANMAPTWLPKLTPDGYKIDAKICHFFWCLLNSFFFSILVDFGWLNGTKLGPRWDQKSISQKTWKNAFGASPLVPNWVHGVQVGSKKQPQIDPKTEFKKECPLDTSFYEFGLVLAPKLDAQIQ